MTYAGLKIEAEELLKVAAAYAGDGAIETAILRTERALRVLRRAKTEKAVILDKIIPKAGETCHTTTVATAGRTSQRNSPER